MPRKDGGPGTPENLITLCQKHHTMVHRIMAIYGWADLASQAPTLDLGLAEPVRVQRRMSRPRWTPPKPRGDPDKCIVCAGGAPALDACGVCRSAVHLRCSRIKRWPVCSVECSIEWMEAFGHA
jgi:hypothetical protein